MSELVPALWERQQQYRDALDRIEHAVEQDPKASTAARELREAIELVGCLRRAVPFLTVVQIHKGFV